MFLQDRFHKTVIFVGKLTMRIVMSMMMAMSVMLLARMTIVLMVAVAVSG